ncbi:MAG: hypothetical protein H6733_07485 [Alphaproteobacteria bacterium]|nr:hypothetical protein [Alphaproteobacteria bacterium]
MPLLQTGVGYGDVDTDGRPGGRELVGDDDHAAVLWYQDGTSFFLRFRVDADPRSSGGSRLSPFAWGVVLDTDADPSDWEVSLILDASGSGPELAIARNTSQAVGGDPRDPAEADVPPYPQPARYAPDGDVWVRDADTALGGTPDWFVDVAFPLDVVRSLGVLDQPVRVVGGVSSNGHALTGDLAGCDDGATVSMATCASDPVSFAPAATCADGTVTVGEGCDDGDLLPGDGCDASCTIEPGWTCDVLRLGLVGTDTWVDTLHAPASWSLDAAGTTVTQSVNSYASVYVSSVPTARVPVRFEVEVQTADDDDFVGFTLGFEPGDASSPSADFLLLDWKQATQTLAALGTADAGIRLSRVQGIPTTANLWAHTGAVTELASAATLGSTGWADNRAYTFEVALDATHLVVSVDGVPQLDVPGPFPDRVLDGRFGFYAFSQRDTRFELLGPLALSVCDPIDTDGDGVPDGTEHFTTGTDPLVEGAADLDGDSLPASLDLDSARAPTCPT